MRARLLAGVANVTVGLYLPRFMDTGQVVYRDGWGNECKS